VTQKIGGNHAGQCLKTNMSGNSEEPGSKSRKTPGAVPAHVGFATVGVKITHLEMNGRIFRGFRCDETVAADTTMAVTKSGDEFGLEGEDAGAVIDHYEVVSGTVHFGEG
jgi:hypothetical protein